MIWLIPDGEYLVEGISHPIPDWASAVRGLGTSYPSASRCVGENSPFPRSQQVENQLSGGGQRFSKTNSTAATRWWLVRRSQHYWRVLMFPFLLKNVWAIRLYIDRFLNDFRHPKPCVIDPNDIIPGNLNCDEYCTESSFKGARAEQGTIDRELWYYCCPKGYTVTPVKNPITGDTSHMVCRAPS
jgi:hypothetical protein